jgi:AcrR family transcriptional regulator
MSQEADSPSSQPRPDKRAAIMDAAIEAFGASGVDGSSVEEIARVAGVAKGTIYLYFKSKDDIFEAILTERWPGPLLSRLMPDPAASSEVRSMPVETALTRLGLGFIEAVEQNLLLFRLALTEAYRYPERGEHLYESTFLKANRALARYLEFLVAQGRIAPVASPLITARCLQGMLVTFVLSQDLLNGKKYTPFEKEEWVREVVKLFLHGVWQDSNASGDTCGLDTGKDRHG